MRFQQFMERSSFITLFDHYQQAIAPLQKTLKNEGFKIQEALILIALFFEDSKPVGPSNLVKTLRIPKDQVSKSLGVLEKSGLIKREFDSKDQRRRQLLLTPKGRIQSSKLIPFFDKTEEIIDAL